MKHVSIIVPVKNECGTIRDLTLQVHAVMQRLSEECRYDLMFVDDGSSDDSWKTICEMSRECPHVHGARLRRNFGKAAALQVGIERTRGDIVITMDGDLQDDPAELPRFLEKLDEGCDLVSGWKFVRHDPVGKILPSRFFNLVTRLVSRVQLNDFNCGFKAYRREIFDSVRLYGELHRFIPALAAASGFEVAELKVHHNPRRHGVSKYGVGRLFKGFLDLLTVVTITRFGSRPGHLFGGIGLVAGFLGLGIDLLLTIEWFCGRSIGNRPLLTLGSLLIIVSIQFFCFGMLGELVINKTAAFNRRRIVRDDTSRHGSRHEGASD